MNLEIPSISRTVRLSETEATIVAFLAANGETHAYGIASRLGKEGLHSSIYVFLNRLQKKGVIDSRTIVRKRDGIRVPYRLVKLKPQIRKAYESECSRTREESNLVHA